MDKKINGTDSERTAALAATLTDAGLDAFGVSSFLKQLAAGSAAGQIKILRRHRLDLLEEIHKQQKALDLIDYIIYKIREGKL